MRRTRGLRRNQLTPGPGPWAKLPRNTTKRSKRASSFKTHNDLLSTVGFLKFEMAAAGHGGGDKPVP